MAVAQAPQGFLHSSFVGLPVVAKVGLGLALVLLVWRVAKFSVVPLLRPNDPQEYPYWIPGVGHLFSFFQDSDNLLARGR